jgi:hypothetical protein
MWVMSWQTPFFSCQASAAVECTPVTPCMYSIDSPTVRAMAVAVSQGLSPCARISSASRTTSSAGSVSRVWPSCSMSSMSVSERERSSSHETGCPACDLGRASTRLVDDTESERCGVITSKAVTRVPQ